MSGETRELIELCEQLPQARRAEVADFARFLLARGDQDTPARTDAATAAAEGGIIRHTDGVVGGKARVRNTRIAVWTLVQFKKLGRADSDLLKDFPGLTAEDLDAVWNYYRDHTAEIEHEIAAQATE